MNMNFFRTIWRRLFGRHVAQSLSSPSTLSSPLHMTPLETFTNKNGVLLHNGSQATIKHEHEVQLWVNVGNDLLTLIAPKMRGQMDREYTLASTIELSFSEDLNLPPELKSLKGRSVKVKIVATVDPRSITPGQKLNTDDISWS